jgi:hypothetical protein
MIETGSESSQKKKDLRKGVLNLLGALHRIKALMMPVKIDGYDLRPLPLDVIQNGEMRVFNPLHSKMDNLRRDTFSVEHIGQPEETHGKEIDPDKLIDGSIVVV